MDKEKIGKNIAFQRNKLNLTQTALAEKLCISPKTVSKWESGNGLPSIEFLPELSKLFGITIDELLYKDIEVTNFKNELEGISTMALYKILSPNYVKFPAQVKEFLKEEWLSFILREEDLTLADFYNFVDSKSKPKNIADCANKLLAMETVSISCIQRRFRIGYPRAAKIRDSLIDNFMIDENSYMWINKNFEKLIELLSKELDGVSFEEPSGKTDIIIFNDENNDTNNIDFKSINLLNDKLSDNEKINALRLLKECSSNDAVPDNSIICYFERQTIKNILSKTNNCLNLEIYNIEKLEDFKNKIKLPDMQHALIVVESDKNANMLDLMTFCDMKIPAEFSLRITDNLDKNYKITIFYV